ncbi:hypothetical protein [Enterobacter hormaechei]|uniref:hypothetical protein n=1 Tax=Enterobacter hormaechei TaxID=158836 RepID=UPI0034595AC1
MLATLSKLYILLILVISPILTLFSLFGLLTFYPISFVVIGFGLFLLLCIMFTALYRGNISVSLDDYLILASFVWFFVIIILHSNLYSYTEDGRYISALRYYSPFFIISLCCYFIFKKGYDFFRTRVGLYSLILMYSGLAVITILFFDSQSFKIDFSKLIDPSFVGVYQIVSDSLAFTVICMLSLSRTSKTLKIVIILITLFFLLILNARSGLIGFLLALCFIFNVKKVVREKPIFIIVGLLIALISLVILIPGIEFISSFF